MGAPTSPLRLASLATSPASGGGIDRGVLCHALLCIVPAPLLPTQKPDDARPLHFASLQSLSRRHQGGGRRLARRAGGRVLRFSRSQRRRQVHHHPLHHRHRPADFRQHQGLRHRRGEGLPRGAPPHRPQPAGIQRRHLRQRHPDRGLDGRLFRHAGGAAQRAHADADREVRPRAARQEAVPRIVGRPQAPRDPRPRAGARPPSC